MRRFARILVPLALALALPALADVIPKPSEPPPSTWMLHLYRESTDGGSERVVADAFVPDAAVATLRTRLKREAAAYARGNYPIPSSRTAEVVSRLRASAQRISVIYTEIHRGGQIRFRTSDTELAEALHDWMAATVQENQRLHPHGGPGEQTVDDDD